MTYGIVGLVYLVVGVVVASSHLAHASTLKPLLSALPAIVLWPLLLGVNLHIKAPGSNGAGTYAKPLWRSSARFR